jgi:DNA polymerase III epsilon subunit-like protein
MQLVPGLASYNLMDLIQSCSLEDSLRQAASEHCPPDGAHAHAALYDALAASLLLRLALRLVPQRSLADWLFYSNPQGL